MSLELEIPSDEEFEYYPDKGLIIKKEPLRKILRGDKIWELRGSSTKLRGQICLIESKSGGGRGKVIGQADLIGSYEIKSVHELNDHARDVGASEYFTRLPYPKTFAWILNNRLEYPTPIAYDHPRGAIIWVNLHLN